MGLERALKAGQLKALISTSALELGIDIGSVDLVMQIQTPKRVASALQRVGRAGHSLAATSRGTFVPTFRDDAMEMLAIVRAMREGDWDRAGEQEMIEPRHLRLPARLDDGGGVVLDNHRGPENDVARPQLGPAIETRLLRHAAGEDRAATGR